MTMEDQSRPLRALICEDEGITVIMLRRALQSAGYEVVGEAAEGGKGIAMARELKPDFILMDITMPGIDGIEATRQILKEQAVAIIMLTAYSEGHNVNAAIEAGACAYLVKPIESRQLVPAIKAALARFEAFQEISSENADLKENLETRKLVERAKGILMERNGLAETDAFRRIQKMSRDRCQSMKITAQEIIQADAIFSSN
jgi:two-component system, response regulator PdtaR